MQLRTRRKKVWMLATLAALAAFLAASRPSLAQTYFYDDAGRLIRAVYPQGNGISYTYDTTDNLTSVSPINLPAAPTNFSVIRLSGTEARLTWQDISGNETGFVIMRRRAGDYLWETLGTAGADATLYIDNRLDPFGEYVYRIAARNSDGLLSAYSAEVVPSDSSRIRLSLAGGGAATALTVGSTGPVRAGYATAEVTSGLTPYGTAVFSLSQAGVVVSEAGVPASPPTKRARIFIDYRTGVPAGSGQVDIFTGFALVNRGSGTANITYTLRDLNAAIVASGRGTLAAGAHFAKFINQMKDVAPDFNLPANFPTAINFASLEFESNQDLSILALRLTTNQRGETLITSTPIADLAQPVSTAPLYFPQFVDGGGYITSLLLLNTTGTNQNGNLEIFDGSGAPLVVRQAGGNSGSNFAYVIPSAGALVFQTDGVPASANAGWVRITPAAGSSTPIGAGVFQFTQNGVLVTESGVPSARPTTRARIYIDKSTGHDTGLALVNLGDANLNLNLKAFQTDGATQAGTGPGTLALGARNHRARFVGQLISGLPDGFTGVLEVSAPASFVALTLRSLNNERGEFLLTTFPIADGDRAAPEPIVFPQIADGGGYTTQFILLSPKGDVNLVLRFFGDDGARLGIAPP